MQYPDEAPKKIVTVYSRRQLLSLLLAGTAGTLAATYWHSVNAEATLNISLPEKNNPDIPSFDIFIALSQLITLRENLDLDSGKRIYNLIIEEPWGKQHISQTYASLKNNKTKIKLDDTTSWFISHILTTWYLGIYYYQGQPAQRVTYEHALMFDAVKNFYPTPITSALGYGAWTKPVSSDI